MEREAGERRTLGDLLGEELRRLVSADRVVLRALPRLAREAHTGELRETFMARASEAKEQAVRMKQVFKLRGMAAGEGACPGMEGILEECTGAVEAYAKGNLRDTALLAGVERMEQYRVAGYGSARDLAKLLGEDEVVKLLEEVLAADTLAAKKFGQIAVQVNAEAFVDTQSPDCFGK